MHEISLNKDFYRMNKDIILQIGKKTFRSEIVKNSWIVILSHGGNFNLILHNSYQAIYGIDFDYRVKLLKIHSEYQNTVGQALWGMRHYTFLGERIYHFYSNFQDMVNKQVCFSLQNMGHLI